MFFKETNLKQTPIGKIPEDWRCVKIGEAISLEYGKGLSESNRVQGVYPVIGSHGIIGYHSEPLVKGPGIVVGRKGTIGAVSWIDTDFWPIDTTYYVKTEREDILLKWLFYELKHVDLAKLHLSDVVPGLKRDLAYAKRIQLPSFEEQEKIVQVLSCVDLAIQKTDEVIAQTESLKKGLMQQLLTKGIGHRKFKDTEIGRMPKEWQVVKLKTVCSKIVGGVAIKTTDFQESGFPVLSKGDIKEFGQLVFDKKEKKYVSNEFAASFPNQVVGIGDTVIALRDLSTAMVFLGLASKIKDEQQYLIAQGVGVLKLDKSQINPDFMDYLSNSYRYRRFIKSKGVGSTQVHTRPDELLSFKFALPNLTEQERIVQVLSSAGSKSRCDRKMRAKLERIKQGLMDLLLTGKVRIKVD